MRVELDRMREDDTIRTARIPELLSRLIAGEERISVVYINGNWLDVDDVLDVARARNFV